MSAYEWLVPLIALGYGVAAILYANWSVRDLERQMAKQERKQG
jgi:hypothetical protein